MKLMKHFECPQCHHETRYHARIRPFDDIAGVFICKVWRCKCKSEVFVYNEKLQEELK